MDMVVNEDPATPVSRKRVEQCHHEDLDGDSSITRSGLCE